MGPGALAANQNQLNTSQNKFQSKFASKLGQNKPAAQPITGGPAFQSQSSAALPSTGSFAGNQTQ